MRAFFKTYYHPRNASLALAGDIDVDDALRLAEKYFGDLTPGVAPDPVRPPAPPPRTGEKRLVLEDRVELPRLYLAWHSPSLFGADDAELDLVADVLAGGKTSGCIARSSTSSGSRRKSPHRRTRARLPATSRSSPPPRRGGRWPSSKPRSPPKWIEWLQTGPTAAEIERGVAQAEAHFISRLQTVGGFGGKSDQLNAYNVFLQDPGYFDNDLARYRAADAELLTRAARTWLATGTRVTLSVVPAGRAGARAGGIITGVGVVKYADRSSLPPLGELPSYQFPEIRRGRSPRVCGSGRSSTGRCR